MTRLFSSVRGASIPSEGLAMLAEFRRMTGIKVVVKESRVWLAWEDEDDGLARRLLAFPGVDLFERREDNWFRFGQRLPETNLPLHGSDLIPLYRAITPLPIEPKMPADFAPKATPLRIVRDGRVRATTALRCSLSNLARWAEMATSYRLASVTAAVAGDCVLVRGSWLPAVTESDRFWGDRLLVPLGFRLEPALREADAIAAMGIGADDLVLLTQDGCEAVPLDAFRPLSRAAVRWAVAEALP